MHIFLIRHGGTALNAAGVLRGQLDIPLNETGEAEARSLGEAFREVPLNAVVSSPLKRALDTAMPVAAGTKAPLSIDDRLSDRFYGELAGHSLEQVEKRFGSIDAAPLVEAWQLLEARAQEAFSWMPPAPWRHQTLRRATRGETGPALLARAAMPSAALVTHDAVIRALLRLLVPALGSVRLQIADGVVVRARLRFVRRSLESCATRQAPCRRLAAIGLNPCCASLTAGESHGRALVAIVEGLPAGLPIAAGEIAGELARRRLGYGRGPRQRFETDEISLLGGVRHGRTFGLTGGDRDRERRVAEVGDGDVA